MIQKANRLNGIGEYYFSQKLREIELLNQQGKSIINLGIGSPDLPPHPEVIKILQEAAAHTNAHAYQGYKGIPALRAAFGQWYQNSYNVQVDPEREVLPLMGSKEGIMHICMTYLNEGDIALIPDPGYPTYQSAVKLAGGTPVSYQLDGNNNWQPDFQVLDDIITAAKGKVKLLWINYPHMPSGQMPDAALFTNFLRLGKKHNVFICHDNPYSFILNDTPYSMMQFEGAKEVGLELNSLSKSHNMAGWRIGVLIANENIIQDVLTFKSNMDSGIFKPLQLAAVKALSLDKTWFDNLNSIYKLRQEKAYQLLELLGCTFNRSQGGMFVWGAVSPGFENGYALSDEVLAASGVFLTPGGIFGSQGDQYIRISLCNSLETFQLAKARIEANYTLLAAKEAVVA